MLRGMCPAMPAAAAAEPVGASQMLADANLAAPNAAGQVIPDSTGPVGYRTSETDAKKRTAEILSRKAAKPDAAGSSKSANGLLRLPHAC